MTLPLLLSVIFGSATAFDYYQVQKRGSLAADTLADLTARSIQMTDDTWDAVEAATSLVMGKYSDRITLEAELFAYQYDENEDELVLAWKFKTGTGYIEPDGETVEPGEFPTLSDGEMIIQSKLDFTYTSPMVFLDLAEIAFHQESVRSPRYAASIPYIPEN